MRSSSISNITQVLSCATRFSLSASDLAAALICFILIYFIRHSCKLLVCVQFFNHLFLDSTMVIINKAAEESIIIVFRLVLMKQSLNLWYTCCLIATSGWCRRSISKNLYICSRKFMRKNHTWRTSLIRNTKQLTSDKPWIAAGSSVHLVYFNDGNIHDNP